MRTLVTAPYISVYTGEPALKEPGTFEPLRGVWFGWVVKKSGPERRAVFIESKCLICPADKSPPARIVWKQY